MSLCQMVPGATAMQAAGLRSRGIGGAAAVMFGFGVHPIGVILIAGLYGLGFYHRQSFPAAVASDDRKSYSLKPLAWILLTAALSFVLLFLFQRRFFDLAFLMTKVDLFAFGGGFSSVPLMFNEVVHVRAWMDGLTLLDGIALGQVTPGPIVITATFIGYMQYGLMGGIISRRLGLKQCKSPHLTVQTASLINNDVHTSAFPPHLFCH